jgi:vancomycin resistance protein YoaR
MLLALGTASARAGESVDAPPVDALPVVRLARGGAFVEMSTSALGLATELTANGTVATIGWDARRFFAECEALADALSLAPPFAGDIDLDDDAVEPIYPVDGEAVDCAALAPLLEQRLAAGGPWTLEVPIEVREASVRADSIDALAAEVRTLLEAPLSLDITFEGEPAGTVTLTPDALRAALRFHVAAAGAPAGPHATLDPAALSDELDPVLLPLGEPARDARFDVGAHGLVRVVAGRPGVRVDAARFYGAAQDAAKKPDKKGSLAVDKGEPSVSSKKAEALQIKGLVASFTTKHACCQPRVANIHRAAALLDGAVVEPGERLSLNQRVGKRTKKRGFVLAPSIGEGEVVETFGGGISQLTTTFYNAVFDGGYAVVSRKPHTFYFPRYPMGVEATLSWPRPDFVFRNDSKTGVLVRASFTDESVTVKLYGDNEGRKVKRFLSKTFDPTDPRTDYQPDESLPLDKPKVKDAGTQGFTVNAGRDIVFANGTKKHEERKVVYHGKPRVVAAHPCAIPKGEKGHRKKGCPRPDEGSDEKDSQPHLTAKSTDKGSRKKDDAPAPGGKKVAVLPKQNAGTGKAEQAAEKDKKKAGDKDPKKKDAKKKS